MSQSDSIFGADDPFRLTRDWLELAARSEPNDPNAIALSTVDPEGMPNVRIVLLKEIEPEAFVFYTNYGSAKGRELALSGKAAFVLHWKTLGRQVRVRGHVQREDGKQADDYYAQRPLESRLGAWASKQSQPLDDRAALQDRLDAAKARFGGSPPRPPFWGGFRLEPVEFEFWADEEYRLHDRERWVRPVNFDRWTVTRLFP